MTDPITEARSRLQKYCGRYPEIAQRFGFSYSTLSKFANGERGTRPSFEFMEKMTAALDELDSDPEQGVNGK